MAILSYVFLKEGFKMKHRFYTALAVVAITSGLALIAQPSFAQTTAGTGTSGAAGGTGGHHNGQKNGGGKGEHACKRILEECEKMGFIKGQWKKDNGLYKDCFDPIVKGTGNTTQDGKPIKIPVSQGEIDACREAKAHHHDKQGSGTQHNHGQTAAPAQK